MERIRLEIKRQPLHILFGLFIIALIYYDRLSPFALLTAIVIAIIGSLYLREKKPKKVYRLLQYVERDYLLNTLPGRGLIAYLIGAFFSIILFEKEVALASIMILALGDSFSRLIGPFGGIKHPFNSAKFLEGMIAGAIAASLGAMLFVRPLEAITASFFAMLLEGIDMKVLNFKIDDNLTIPLIAGAIIWLIRVL